MGAADTPGLIGRGGSSPGTQSPSQDRQFCQAQKGLVSASCATAHRPALPSSGYYPSPPVIKGTHLPGEVPLLPPPPP